MWNDEDLKRIPLSANDQEYKDVERAIRFTAQTTVNQIVKVGKQSELYLVNNQQRTNPYILDIGILRYQDIGMSALQGFPLLYNSCLYQQRYN